MKVVCHVEMVEQGGDIRDFELALNERLIAVPFWENPVTIAYPHEITIEATGAGLVAVIEYAYEEDDAVEEAMEPEEIAGMALGDLAVGY